MTAGGEALLDNAVYEALCGPHARFAQTRGRVRRYAPDVAPFLGLPPAPAAADWQDAAALLAPDGYAAVLSSSALPSGWHVARTFELVQMVGERVAGAPCPEAVALSAADVPEMLELVALTEPGPFLARTVERGDYIGIRRGGTLVLMAGERLRVPGWTEISAVCTRPELRGQGLASRLIAAVASGIQSRSEGIFLHVLAENATAIRLYEQLGFRTRLRGTLSVVRPSVSRES